MIVSMKKVTVLTLERHREKTLRTLRKLGVIHPEPLSTPSDDAVDKVRQEYQALYTIVKHLEQRAQDRQSAPSQTQPRTATGQDPEEPTDDHPVARFQPLFDELKNATERRAAVDREIRDTEPLGDFDPETVRELEQKGVPIRLFRRSGKQAVSMPPDVVLHVLHRDRNQTIYAIIGSGEPDPADQAVPLPARSLGAMRRERTELDDRIHEINGKLNDAVRYLPFLRRQLTEQADALRFVETSAGMGQRESIVYLRGYCPTDKLDAIRAVADDQGWAMLVETPDPADPVPTLIRHPKWVRPIRAVLNLMGILPGYREIDVSASFLIFFSLFFAMIVGDAGYGFVFLGLTALAHRRWRHAAPPEPFRMLTVLSIGTIVWGLLSGNVFGTTWFPTLVPWLTERKNMMMLCFLIGAIHLTVAHGWNAITILNSPRALAQAGWIALTWTMFLTARSLILGAVFPVWGYALLGIGLLLVVVFMTPAASFKTEWVSHAMLPLTIINNFVDVVSYVRLFAVGYATLAVAEAFNAMAIVDDMSIVRGLLAALILFFGHTLNIILCALSVLVHGIRLNTLEFSGHIGMQWTGFAYRPFEAEAGKE